MPWVSVDQWLEDADRREPLTEREARLADMMREPPGSGDPSEHRNPESVRAGERRRARQRARRAVS